MAIVISASKLAELLRTADQQKTMYVRVLSASRLGLGTDPDRPTLTLDLSKERIGPYNRPGPDHTDIQFGDGAQTLPPNGTAAKLTRRSGDYGLEIKGRRVSCRSLKEMLSEGLRALEAAAPGTVEMLSNIKARSRRIVARDPNHLFDKQHLTKKYAEQLMPGWWYGTNNSARETEGWLQRACSLAGLEWGRDFKMN
jgi:hypothetical protein